MPSEASPPEFQIRRATRADVTILSELGAETFRQTYSPHVDSHMIEAYVREHFALARVKKSLLNRRHISLLAEVRGVPVGYAALLPNPHPECVTGTRPIQLLRFYLLAPFQGRGFGKQLLDRCLAEALAHQYDVLWLGVWDGNHAAMAFYQHQGFIRVGEVAWTAECEDLQYKDTDVVMTRRLDAANIHQ